MNLVHPFGINMAVSSNNVPNASGILLSMDSSTGVTVNTRGYVADNLVVNGNTSFTGTVSGLPIEQELRQILGMGPNGKQVNVEFGGQSPTAMFSIPITAPSAIISGN